MTKILSNDKYIGVWVWGMGKYFINPGTGQTVWKERPRNEWIYLNGRPVNDQLAIVGRELWDRVQEIKRGLDHARQQGETRQRQVFVRTSAHASEHFLSGLLRCGACGASMIVVSGRRGGYYGCFEAHRKATCKNRSLIRARDVEARVLSELARLLQQEDLARDLTDRYNRQRNAILSNTEKQEVNLQEELIRLRAEVGNLVTFLARGQDSDAVRTALTSKEARVREIEKLLVGVSGLRSDRLFVTPAAVKEKLNRLEEILSQDRRAARQILRGLIANGITLTSPSDIPTLTVELNLPGIVREHLAAG